MTAVNTTRRPIAPRSAVSGKGPGGVILLYHRVADTVIDPQLLCVSPSRFRDQLAALTRHHAVLSLRELVDRSSVDALPDHAVALTFDDGYADNFVNAAPLLQAFSAPATVFVASGYVGERCEFWWDALARLLLSPGTLPQRLSLRVGEVAREWNLDRETTYHQADFELHRRWSVVERDHPTPRHRAYRELFEWLRPMRPIHRDAAIERLERRRRASHGAVGAEPPAGGVPHDAAYALTPDQLRRIASDQRIEIGAHTVNHPVLSALTIDDQRREITRCKAELETLLDKPVTSFSYPFGGRRDYTPDTVTLVRQAGFARCCSNFEGRVTPAGDACQLPRLLVRNWDGDALLQRIEEVVCVG